MSVATTRRGRAIAYQECGRVHGAQVSRPHVADDDDLDASDTVHADGFGARRHRHLTAADAHSVVKASAKALSHPWVAGTQQNENAPTVLQSRGSRGECAVAAPCNHEIDGSDHGVAPAAARPSTSTGPLNVRRNASS